MTEQKHGAFVDLVARGIAPHEAFRQAYNKPELKDQAARQGAWRLMKKETIVQAIAEKKEVLTRSAEAVAVQELARERKFKLLDFNTKREILYKISTGAKFAAGVDKEGKRVYRYPSDQDRIRAIELDNEMTGEGFRPPDPAPGNTFNGPVYNTVIRKTVFRTRETTAQGHTYQIEGGGE